MMAERANSRQGAAGAASHRLFRWECRCQQSPVLLATYDGQGRIHIKARDRYWHIEGVVRTVCPRCGAEHALDLRVEKSRSRQVEQQRRSRES